MDSLTNMNCILAKNQEKEREIRERMNKATSHGEGVALLRELGALYVRDTEEDIELAVKQAK